MDHVDSMVVLLLALLFVVAAVAGLARRFAVSRVPGCGLITADRRFQIASALISTNRQ